MEATFFELNGTVMVSIKTDASTSVDLVATKAHKARFKTAWDEFVGPIEAAEAVEEAAPKPKPKAKGKAKSKR